MNRLTLLCIVGWFFLAGCASETCEIPQIEIEEIEIEVVRHEDHLFNLENVDEVLLFLQENPTLKVQFLGSEQYPNDTILANELLKRIQYNEIKKLAAEANTVFGELEEIRSELATAIGYMRYYYPNTKIPRVETMVTGFGSSEMYVSDSLIIIGLDYYLGPEATYRPNNYPGYILNRFQKEYIVPAIVLLLADRYTIVNPSDRTMLADMIFYGKKYQFTQTMLPCIPDSLVVWYTGKELKDVNENQEVIWANFLENELLYETNYEIKERFLGERPNTYEISAVCPGRIGSWVGWEIVRKYVDENPGTDFKVLMANPDAQSLFTQSKYKGRSPR